MCIIIPYPMDEQRFITAAPLLEGEYDFSCFAASDDRDAGRTVEGPADLRARRASKSGDQLIYRVTGSGFLKHMVRNIVGTLLEAGKGNVDPDEAAMAADRASTCQSRANRAGLRAVPHRSALRK